MTTMKTIMRPLHFTAPRQISVWYVWSTFVMRCGHDLVQERPGSLGSSWGISGVGMGFNSTWGTTEPGSESAREDEEEYSDDESGDADSAEAAHEAIRRLELNTHLNSRTSFTGFDGMQAASPMLLSGTPAGTVPIHPGMNANGNGPNIPDRQNSGPKLSISNLSGPRLIPTRTTGALPSPDYPASPVHVVPHPQAQPGEKAAFIDEQLSTQSIFPPVSSSPKTKSPSPQRSRTLPCIPSHSAPSTRIGSPVITTTDRPHISSLPPFAQSSLPLESSPSSSPLQRTAITPSRPSIPVRSVSSSGFGSVTTPRVRSRRRNASSNRISLVAGRQVPLPFDPTADIDPLPPLVPSASTPKKSIVSGKPESLSSEVDTAETQSRFPIGFDQIRHNAARSSMPIIPPLLRPPQAPPSRIPSVTSVAPPSRPVDSNDSSLLSPSVNFTSSPVSTPQSQDDPVREGATSLSRSSSKRSTSHRHRKSRSKDKESTVISGGRSVNDFVITGEAGRGAYGLVKRVKENLSDGSLGVRLLFVGRIAMLIAAA